MQLRAQLQLWRDGIAVYDQDQRGEPGVELQPLGMLDRTSAQVLMDDLWRSGIRPTEGAGTAGSMAATQAHLVHVSGILSTVLPLALRKPE